MLGSGSSAGVGKYLHCKTGEHLGICHGLVVVRLAITHVVGSMNHYIQRLLSHVTDTLAEVFARNEACYFPVCNGSVF